MILLRFVSIATLLWTCAASAAQTAPATPTTRPATQPAKSVAAYQSFAMTHAGDAARGRSLFFDDQKLACARCHSIDGKGSKAGPDLLTIGDKFGRADLIESILAPSATIAIGYSTTIIKTKSGETFDGILKDEADGIVKLMAIDSQLAPIKVADIQRRWTSDISLMPEGLQSGLTHQEFADLIDYLATLKLPANAAVVSHGMPAEILELPTPVALRPFNRDENRFEHPVWFGPLPGVMDCFAVVEHESGKIWILEDRAGGQTKSLFLETAKFQPGTRGLLGMVFHPNYAANRRYFIVKHFVEDGRFSTKLFEGQAADDLKHDSGRPLKLILNINATASVHYGGGLQFGPDGYLYVGMGDSGPQQDPRGNGQNMNVLLGKMLRIDVDHQTPEQPYAIPPDNPFINRPGVRPEIWAYGFREPWRFSFDPLSNDLWVGDVGQDLYEEVDIVRRGENYGWNVYEGFSPFSNKYRREGEHYVPPVFAYSRRYGVSVTGGYVYRADAKSSFYGVYIFGEYQTRRIFALTQEKRVLEKVRQIGLAPQRIVSFGRDARGDLYLVGYEGTIYKMDFANSRFE